MRILVTGGAGFIGSAYIRHIIASTSFEVLNLDKLTYAADLHRLHECETASRYRFCRGSIEDRALLKRLLAEFKPDTVVNFAAESHVDRSIADATNFIQSNVQGVFNLLSESLAYWQQLPDALKARFRFHQISTDEVFGSLGESGVFTESSPYQPRSPYSATKASANHLVEAWQHTYGLPTLITHACNNFGPYQHREKLIPTVIHNAINGLPIPIYGTGQQIREWLYVDDHVRALMLVLQGADPGEAYNIGMGTEVRNLDLVGQICDHLDLIYPREDKKSYRVQITFVSDRPGHDFRYAMDSSKLCMQFHWSPQLLFSEALLEVIKSYLAGGDPTCN